MVEAEILALPGPLPGVQFPQTVVVERDSLLVEFVATLVANEAVVEVVDNADVAPSFGGRLLGCLVSPHLKLPLHKGI